MLRADLIETFVLDGHMSVLEGSAAAIARRVMVTDEDYERAKALLRDAGEGDRIV